MNTRLSAPPLTAAELMAALQTFDADSVPHFDFPDGQRYPTGIVASPTGPRICTTASVVVSEEASDSTHKPPNRLRNSL